MRTEAIKEKARKRYLAHRDERLKKMRDYYQSHKKEMSERQKRTMQKPENKEKARKWHRERDRKNRQDLIKLYGGKCCNCGFSDWRALQIDHINGGGGEERKECSTYQYKKRLLTANGNKYQLLCANCNKIKQHENNEFSNQWTTN
jgi:predicted HNH restriction endonuclease